MPLPWPEHERVGKDLGRVRNQCEDESHDSQCRRPLATRLHSHDLNAISISHEKPETGTAQAQADSPDPVRRGVRGRAKQQIISTVGDTAYRLQRCRICVQRTRTQHPLYRPRGGAHLSRDTTSDACVVRRVPGVRCGARAERAPRLRAGAWAARGPGRSRRQKGNNRKTATSNV